MRQSDLHLVHTIVIASGEKAQLSINILLEAAACLVEIMPGFLLKTLELNSHCNYKQMQ